MISKILPDSCSGGNKSEIFIFVLVLTEKVWVNIVSALEWISLIAPLRPPPTNKLQPLPAKSKNSTIYYIWLMIGVQLTQTVPPQIVLFLLLKVISLAAS